MPTYLENLATERDNIQAKLAEMSLNPKPDYSVDGESYSWAAMYDMLSRRQTVLNQLIQNAQPYCVTTRLFT